MNKIIKEIIKTNLVDNIADDLLFLLRECTELGFYKLSGDVSGDNVELVDYQLSHCYGLANLTLMVNDIKVEVFDVRLQIDNDKYRYYFNDRISYSALGMPIYDDDGCDLFDDITDYFHSINRAIEAGVNARVLGDDE